MEKLKLHTPNLTAENIEKLTALFPNCVTETKDEKTGQLKRAIDFDQLRQELSDHIVEGPRERYHLDWPGKREALLAANAPIAKTLRPCREESVDFDTTKNLFIEGDNLDALKLLQETYLGKVKLIYIDPPYNTGKDFIYSDRFVEDTAEYLQRSSQTDDSGSRLVLNSESVGRFHSNWLNLMYPRLRLARNLLSDDGAMLVSIDEGEAANLRKLGEEVFGGENYVGEIVWKNSSKNDQDFISIQHEYIMFFVKDRSKNKGEWLEKKEGLGEIYKAFDGFRQKYRDDWEAIHAEAKKWFRNFPESNPIFECKHYNWMDERGVYFASDISGPNDGQYVYDIKHPKTGKNVRRPARGWFCPADKLNNLIQQNLVHFGSDETSVPCLKTYLKNTEFRSLSSVIFKDGRAASKRLRTLFSSHVFTNPKDEQVLASLMKAIGINGNDLVLDFFAGSASTAHAVFNLNAETASSCRSIVVQLPEDLNAISSTATGLSKKVANNAIEFLRLKGKPEALSEISKERIRLAGRRIIDEADRSRVAVPDIGFRVLKIDTSNMHDVRYAPDAVKQDQLTLHTDNIKADRTPEDLLFQVLIDWGVDLALPIEQQQIAGKTVFFVDGNALAACFDTNVTEDLVKELAKRKPLRAVFRDSSFENDSTKINVAQIFRLLSPETEVKSL